jgi:hypothetical protein
MSGAAGLEAIGPGAVASIVHDLATVATSQNARQLGQYIAQIAANAAAMVQQANAPLFFRQQLNNVPYGCTLGFVIGNVDDEVTVRGDGLIISYRKDEQTSPQSTIFGIRGPNVIIVELGNSGGYNTSVTMNVNVTGANVTNPGSLLAMKYEANDPAFTQHTRYFILRFNVV